MQVNNPILPGCYPDPSICRVGDDYYLVLSTFEYLPGLPVFHSRDLANWQQLGHVIDRPGMMDFDGIGSSGGLFAPTIRYNPANNKFYVVCTLVDRGVNEKQGKPAGNFIVAADNPAGPWSDPIWLDKPGIDPSLFFDSDGTIWLHGTRLADPGEWFHQTEVWLQELDPETLQTKGEEYVLWNGAVRGAVWTEGPHIYKVGDWYYLLTAEGGTEFHHAISIARSRDVTGPYEGNKCNPIFTHRNLGRSYPIMGVGHADLFPFGSASFENPLGIAPGGSASAADGLAQNDAVEGDDPYANPISTYQETQADAAGGWYAVMLGMRLYGGYHYNLGRETFLVPVTWEDDWPVFAAPLGRIPDVVEVPDAATWSIGVAPDLDSATNAQNDGAGIKCDDLRWCALRDLPENIAQRTPDGGWKLPLRTSTLSELGTPAFLGIRQTAQNCKVAAKLRAIDLQPGEWMGLAIRQSEKDYATFMVTPLETDQNHYTKFEIRLTLVEKGIPKVIATKHVSYFLAEFDFGLKIEGQRYQCVLRSPDGGTIHVGEFDGRTLDTAAAGGFLGLWIGVYATTDNPESTTVVTAGLGYLAKP